MEFQDSIIKDIKLAEWGRKEMDLAEVEMPGLMAIREEYGPQQVLKGARIMGSLHMTIQTAVLIETLHKLGADVRWCSCNIYSTQDHAASAIVQSKTGKVFAVKGESLQDYWKYTLMAMTWPNGSGPQLIVDDGGDATMMLLEGKKWEEAYEKNKSLPDPKTAGSEDEFYLLELLKEIIPKDIKRFRNLLKDFYGVSEETTTGVHRLMYLDKTNQLIFPAFNVNDSVTKSKFDNIYGCRHSLPDGIFRATDVMVAGKKTVICGYGDVGKGCVQAMKGCGSVVYVTEVDPINALQACMEGIQVKKLESIVSEADIFVTATGCKNIITIKHMEKMKNNAIVCNIGHFDCEIDTKGLKEFPGIKKINIKDQVDRYVFPDGHGILLLADGRLVNLGCATGHPSFVMSNSFTNQSLAQIELWVNRSNGKYKAKLYKLPKHLDEKVARYHLKSLGAELTELSDEQANYLHIPVSGPYKHDEYRY